MYLKGEGSPLSVEEALNLPDIWIRATSQIFFSIGVCMGTLTSFGSYKEQDKPIIMDALIIAGTNSFVSFMSGFAVFSIVGYLNHIGAQEKGTGGGTGLAFVAFPAAITKLGVPNFWAVLLFLTLFTLGVDSAFSWVEAASTVIYDTESGRKINRMLIAGLICFFGCLCSIVFSSNFGFDALDVVDFYLAAYLLVPLGILQCTSVGWVFQVKETIAKADDKEKIKKSFLILTVGYWASLVIFGILGFFAFYSHNYVAAILLIVFIFISIIVSWKVSGLPFMQYYDEILFCGTRHMARVMTRLSYADRDRKAWWKKPFELYWGLCIKFIIPGGLWWMLMMSFRARMDDGGYGDYHVSWNYIGMVFPILGFILFIVPVFKPTASEQDEKECEDAINKMFYGKGLDDKKPTDGPTDNNKVAQDPDEKAGLPA